MSDEVTDLAEPTLPPARPVRFFGTYRSDEFGVVGSVEASKMNGIIRHVFNRDFGTGVSEGTLANILGYRILDRVWRIAVERLIRWKLIDLVPAHNPDSVRIKLTGPGRNYAIELIGDRQLSGKSRDGEEDETWK